MPVRYETADDLLSGATARAHSEDDGRGAGNDVRSEEHTSELQSQQEISYAVFCLKKKNFFNDTATTEIYTLSLHDALPIFML